MDGTRSEVFILIHFGRKEVLIGGTLYAGEIKKSIFTVMNYLLPAAGVLPMHCAASYGRDDQDVAVLFGLSGTGGRRPSPPTRSGRWWATTSTAGATAASSTSREAATPR